jgi:hypothetical protein
MSIHEYRLIGAGWFLLIAFLTIFWYFTLQRLGQVLRDNLPPGSPGAPGPGIGGLFIFVFRGDFVQSRNPRLVEVCKKLRKLLWGYVGGVLAFIVFVVKLHSYL